jgi:hypothetical protein
MAVKPKPKSKPKKKPRINPLAAWLNCLRCSKRFRSPDRCRVRICDHCKRNAERTGKLGDRVSSCRDVSASDAGDTEASRLVRMDRDRE